jgi:hypothetical protein
LNYSKYVLKNLFLKKLETGNCLSKLSTSFSSKKNSQKNPTATTNLLLSASVKQTNNSEQQPTSIFDTSSLFSKLKNKNNTKPVVSTKSTMNQDNNKPDKSNTDNNTLLNTSGNLNNSSASALATSAPSTYALIESAESSDNDTSTEFNRLTDLLQSRGLPSNIVNAFGSKVQQFLHRTMSSGITTRSQQLINSLQQTDESIKLTALVELCQLLVMGNEDTLVGFPIKQAVPLLLNCMNSESENFELMNHACRALTYMMESLPRSSSAIAEGIGIFLEKLQVIQCMDVAEQSLTALEILSRRHSKQILNATQSGSVNACLTYIDFFSITAQRNALQIAANCIQNMVKNEFVHIQSSLPILSQRLTHSDKKSVESVSTLFARLVENFQHDPQILKEIASHNILTNMQHLLVIQPPLVSSHMFVTILHTIYLMCFNCSELSISLLENNIAQTLLFLLMGNNILKDSETSNAIEIQSSRSPQELYEIVSIIGEIMPRLPQTGIFSIDEILKKSTILHHNENIIWQWKDENEIWRPYTLIDSRIIEAAHIQEEDECVLNTMGRTYVIDFNSMVQINEETGTSRPISRKILNLNNNNENIIDKNISKIGSNFKSEYLNETLVDNRLENLKNKPESYAYFIKSLFLIVYEIYNSSAGPSIKHRSLRTLLRLIYYSSNLLYNYSNNKKQDEHIDQSNNLLFNLLKSLPISSQIASMLANNDPKIIVSALQMAEILMKTLPEIFSIYFHREGVIYQIDRLIDLSAKNSADENANYKKNDNLIQEKHITRLNMASSESFVDKRKTRASNLTSKKNVESDINNDPVNNHLSLMQFSNTPNEEKQNSSSNKYFRNIFSKSTANNSTNNRTTNSTSSSNKNIITPNFQQFSLLPNNSDLISNSNSIKQNNDIEKSNSKPTSSNEYSFPKLIISNQSNSSISSAQTSTSIQIPKIKINESIKDIKTSYDASPDSKVKSHQNLIDYTLINENKDKVRRWISDQAKIFRETYFGNKNTDKPIKNETESQNPSCSFSLNVLQELKTPITNLESENDNLTIEKTNEYLESLKKISKILKDSDISSFEMIHSGLIDTLVKFLSLSDKKNYAKSKKNTISFPNMSVKSSYINDINNLIEQENKIIRVKIFLNVFANLPFTFYSSSEKNKFDKPEAIYFLTLTTKLHNCVNQLEQFAVKVHDIPNSIGYGKNAIKFFTNHQIKCSLQRYPSVSSTLRQWKGGYVKVDPLAVVGTIEKYLLMRGIHKPQNTNTNSSILSSSLPPTSALTSSLFKPKSDSKLAPSTVKSSSKFFLLKAAEFATDKFKSKTPKTSYSDEMKDNTKLMLQKDSKISKKTSTNKNRSICVKSDELLDKNNDLLKSNSSKNSKSKLKGSAIEFLNKNSKSYKSKTDETEHNYSKNNRQKLRSEIDNLEETASNIIEEHDIYDEDLIDDDNADISAKKTYKDDRNDEDENSEDGDNSEYDDNFDDDDDDDDDDSDEIDDYGNEDDEDDDIQSAMDAILSSSTSNSNLINSKNIPSQSNTLPKIELLINDHILPSNMTIYQAIKQYSDVAYGKTKNLDMESDLDSALLNNAIWSKVHLIHYRISSSSEKELILNDYDKKRSLRNNTKQSISQNKPIENSPTHKKDPSKKNDSDISLGEHSFQNLYTNLINKWEFNDNQDNFIKDKSIYSIYLLKFLNTLNRGWFILYRQLFSYEKLLFNPKINQNEFVNNKLTAKANRQLQDPLVIMTGHLPNWLPNLMHSCQFLFPFETRLMYFNITGLDRDRALQKLLDSNADLLSSQSQTESPGSNERMVPKLDKKKKTISRSIDLIKQADLIISEFSINTNNLATTSNFSSTNKNKQPLLEIQYESEVGTGLGPTLEFYALVSLEIQKCDNEMWRGEKIKFQNSFGSNKNEFFFYSPTGLFPAPISKNTSKLTQLAKIVSKFKFFGKFAAKAIIDSRVMDIQLSLAFYKSLIDPESLYEEDLKYVDLQLYTSLETLREYLRKRRKILIEAYKRANNSNTNDNAKTSNENLINKNLEKELTELENNVNALDLDFRYPGYENIELKKNGKDILVTLDNLEEYIDLITDWTLVKGVQQQIESFKEGFESIMPLSSLKIFYAEELERLFCGSGFVKWDSKMLVECTRCDHGYTHDSKAVQNLFDIMSSFNADEQRQFLQFVTGSPRLPVGGLRSLTPPLTIVRKSLTDTNLKTVENHLPSVMTCVNYLKLPEYSSVELMRTKLFKAMIDGQLSFHLS